MNKGIRIALAVCGGIVALGIIAAAAWGFGRNWGGYGGWGMMRGGGMMGGFGGGWWLVMGCVIFFGGLIAIGIAAFVPRSSCMGHHTDTTHQAETPVDILRRRYASGEINKEEFEQKKNDLQ